jgi:hypothetical protein
VWYGDRAVAYLENNVRTVSLGVVGLLVAGLASYALWRRHGARKADKVRGVWSI